jgi:protein-L-isoaspartate O-methyltransferase
MVADGSATALTRKNIMAHQIARRGIKDRRVLDAMAKVPREMFVAAGMRSSLTKIHLFQFR